MTKKKTTAKAAAPATPRVSRTAKAAARGEQFEPEAIVTAMRPTNSAETRQPRGPGRPKKVQPTGNLYEVTYQGGGKSAASPTTRVVQAPDESTAICAANRLNNLGTQTHNFFMKATLINPAGQQLDTDFRAGDDDDDALDPIQEQTLGSSDQSQAPPVAGGKVDPEDRHLQ